MAFPASTKYVIVGAGIHGLSTAYHLALELKSKGTGDGGFINDANVCPIAGAFTFEFQGQVIRGA